AAAAIGLDTQRGDLLAVQNLSFQESPVEKPVSPSKVEVARKFVVGWLGVLRYVAVLALFLIVYFLILRPVKRQGLTTFKELPTRISQNAKALTTNSAGGAVATEAVETALPEGTDQARRATALKRQLTEKVKAEPAVASRLVQTWIRESAK